MSSISQLWPAVPSPGSPFSADDELGPLSTFTVGRVLVAEAVLRLKAGAEMAEDRQLAAHGSHFLLLRPTLVSTAKAAWLLRPDASSERVRRAVELIDAEQQQGASAMRKAVQAGAPDLFMSVAAVFDRTRNELQNRAGQVDDAALKKPPRDEQLIRDLGRDMDKCYGTTDAGADLQLLWNVSSSLSHGERWHSLLTSHARGVEVAQTLTARSLDAVCSAINVTGLRVTWMAASPPERDR